jgi:hypothetical protein
MRAAVALTSMQDQGGHAPCSQTRFGGNHLSIQV